MNILTPNRGRIGQAVSNTFDKVLSAISGVWSIEHHDDGTHGDVTAESLAVSGDTSLEDVSIGGFVSALDFGDADGSVVVDNDNLTDLFDMSDYPSLASTADLVTPVLESSRDTVPAVDDSLSLGFLTAATAGRRWKNGYFSKHVNAKTVNAVAGLYDFDRDKYLGQWTTFTPSLTAATGTWTGSTITTAQYMLIGKTLFIQFQIDAGNNSAVTAELKMAIPGSFVADQAVMVECINALDLGAYVGDVNAYVVAADTNVHFFKGGGGTWAINAANGNRVRGLIFFEIQ